jgi:integral membrane protein (TIGR01906 family)
MMEKRTIERIILALLILLAASTAAMIYLSNTRTTTFDRTLYQKEYVEYSIAANFDPGVNLTNETDFLLNYLEKGEGEIQTGFFNAREKSHLIDVRGLYEEIYFFNTVAAITSMICLVLLVYFFKRLAAHMPEHEANERYKKMLYTLLITTGAIVDGIAVLLAITAFTFDTSFITFHEIFFTSDTWMLNPATDNLIRMFPQEFFYDMFTRIVLMSVVFATLLLVVGLVMKLGKPKMMQR